MLPSIVAIFFKEYGLSPLTYIGPIIKGEDTLLYGSDVNILASIGGKEVNVF